MDCGKISLCAEKNCKFICCNFDSGNYILLFPGELDKAINSNISISHLQILEEDSFGGHKAVCNAKQKHNCDNGYKPLDCKFYPLFPIEIIGDNFFLHKGIKCPLKISEIANQNSFVYNETENIIIKNEKFSKWLKNVKFVGYEKVKINIT
ncbi:MAG: hypothetical protein HXX09_10690 [Bacteroidetes bacterium]|nr:hypothetical protein [Bacteroidota bacterium]